VTNEGVIQDSNRIGPNRSAIGMWKMALNAGDHPVIFR